MIYHFVELLGMDTTRDQWGFQIPARPLNPFVLPRRLKAAWLVFTGRADALIWPGNQ